MKGENIVVIASLSVKEGMEKKFSDAALEVAAKTRTEPGCVAYEVLQDVSDARKLEACGQILRGKVASGNSAALTQKAKKRAGKIFLLYLVEKNHFVGNSFKTVYTQNKRSYTVCLLH